MPMGGKVQKWQTSPRSSPEKEGHRDAALTLQIGLIIWKIHSIKGKS